jgi:hypothetical protein
MAARATLDKGLSGRVVPYGIFTGIAVLQVGEAFIPILAGWATQIRTGEKSSFATQINFNLEHERFVFSFIRCWRASIHENVPTSALQLGCE